jgi:hypothetical protein
MIWPMAIIGRQSASPALIALMVAFVLLIAALSVWYGRTR